MAGGRITPAMTAPAILLVRPQMGENIGAAARVMGNFGLSDLRIVAPRDGWPNPAAETMSAGAFESAVTARTFETLAEAVADLDFVLATTARQRGMEKPVFSAKTGAAEIAKRPPASCGVMFGAEKTGLLNEEIVVADAIVTYPVSPQFFSLNLAQAVGVFAHEWAAREAEPPASGVGEPAPRGETLSMIDHLEAELDRAGYFFPPEKKPVVLANLANMFTRAGWTRHEVQAFRGAIKALAVGRGKARITRDDDA